MVAATDGSISMVTFEKYFSMTRTLPALALMRKL
jgi:hypothetical protein